MANNEQKKFYITTPIYYTNGKFHLGHAYTSILADAIARYHRHLGEDVFFLTGTDEHGMKVEANAKAVNMEPKAFVDNIVKNAKNLWEKMNISYDKFIRTTDDYHVKTVQKIFKRLYEQGDIYLGKYEGLYCKACEAFYTPSQAKDGVCPECGKPLENASEEAYFFKLSKYQDRLIKLFKENKEFIKLDSTRNEMLNNFLLTGLEDLCVSRTSFSWGVPVDFNPKHVVYVWVDALTNYITALGYLQEDDSNFKKFWPADLHLMAKEITRFHTIIWPAFLMALDLPLPKQIHAHGWLIANGGAKMGKSNGNGFDPLILADRYGTDAVRHFLLKEGPLFQDTPYSSEVFLNTFNKDLVNTLGNLCSRVSAMINQNFENGLISNPTTYTDVDKEYISEINALEEKVTKEVKDLNIKVALDDIYGLLEDGNKYLEKTEPWKKAKEEGKKEEVNTILYVLLEAIRVSAILLDSFIPATSKEVLDRLNVGEEYREFNNAKYLENIGNREIEKKDALFPRLKVADELKYLEGEK